MPKGPEHRTSLELLGLKEGVVRTNTPVRWVHSDAQLANSLTKDSEQQQLQRYCALGQCWKIVDDPLMRSARNRKVAGLEVFEEDTTVNPGGKPDSQHRLLFPGDVSCNRTQMSSGTHSP